MEFIQSLFSSAPGLDRLNPAGIALMAVGILAALFVYRFVQKASRLAGLIVRLIGLVAACAGALIAMM